MVVRAVTLDAGGTLFDVAEPVGETYARLAARHGIRRAPGELEGGFRTAFAGAPPLAFPGASPARLADHERAWWYAVVLRAFGETAPGASFEAFFDEAFAHYAEAGAWRVFPEVPDTLAALRAHGLRLAIVSNFDARLIGLVRGLGLAALLDAVVHSSRAGAAKPDARIFADAAAALGVSPGAVLHAGDGALQDVEGARAAGMRAVLVDRAGRRPAVPDGVTVIGSLAGLPALVQP